MNTAEKLSWLHVLRRNMENPHQDLTYELDLLDKFVDENDFAYDIKDPVEELISIIEETNCWLPRDFGRGQMQVQDLIDPINKRLYPAVMSTIKRLEKVA